MVFLLIKVYFLVSKRQCQSVKGRFSIAVISFEKDLNLTLSRNVQLIASLFKTIFYQINVGHFN
jgi:hypothetical protein